MLFHHLYFVHLSIYFFLILWERPSFFISFIQDPATIPTETARGYYDSNFESQQDVRQSNVPYAGEFTQDGGDHLKIGGVIKIIVILCRNFDYILDINNY